MTEARLQQIEGDMAQLRDRQERLAGVVDDLGLLVRTLIEQVAPAPPRDRLQASHEDFVDRIRARRAGHRE